MQVRLFVERDQNECVVNLAGTAYRFKRNEFGHLVSDITDKTHIAWVSNPMHNTSFEIYSPPKPLKTVIAEEAVEDIADLAPEPHPEVKPEPEKTSDNECPICGKKFETARQLSGHIGGAHRRS